MTNTYTINPTINTISSILPGSTVGGTVTTGSGGAGSANTFGSAGTITFGGAGGLTNQPLGNITISSGGAGQIYTTTGTNGVTWANPNDNVMIVKQTPPELEVKGRMVINGVDLEERLNTIEKVLQIPERDVKLEAKHPKLKELYDA